MRKDGREMDRWRPAKRSADRLRPARGYAYSRRRRARAARPPRSRCSPELPRWLDDFLHRALAHRAGDHPGMAEAAAARAAAHDLDRHPVVDGVDIRDDEWVGGGGSLATMRLTTGSGASSSSASRCLRRSHPGGNGLRTEPGRRRPRSASQATQQLLARCAALFPGLVRLDDLVDHLFAFADHEGIDKGVHRLRIDRWHARRRSPAGAARALGGDSGMPARSRTFRVLVYSVS